MREIFYDKVKAAQYMARLLRQKILLVKKEIFFLSILSVLAEI